MQHLDDGRLQAWLDRDRSGMSEMEAAEVEDHIAGCEVCAGRLAELDETSGRARSLLAVAAPSGEGAPDFADVVRRSRRRGPSGRGGRWWMAAGWAASLVAAVGLGWMSNDLLRLGPEARAPAPAADGERAVAVGDLPPVEGERAAAPAAEETDAGVPPAEQEGTATEPVPAVTEQARAETPPPAPGDPDPDLTLAPTTFEDAVLAERAEEPRSLRVDGQVRRQDGRPLAAAQVTVPGTGIGTVTGDDGTFSLLLPRDARVADSARPLAITAQLIGFRSSSLEIAPDAAGPVSVDFRLEEAAVALDELVVTGTARAGTVRAELAAAHGAREVWVPVTRARAESESDFMVLTVPDLRILEIELGEVAGAVAVRVRQALDSGATLTLVQRRADGPAAEPTLPEGQPLATVRRGDLRVTGSAPIPADSLRALLDRVPFTR